MSEDRIAFVRAHTRLATVAFVPEVRLHLAEEPIGLWELTEGEYRSDQPPPFWAFAWSGGQGLARYLLDHPELVTGRRVLDLASGSGLVAIAAAVAGATRVSAVDIDPTAIAAIGLNAAANQVRLRALLADLLDAEPPEAELIVAGDVFYSQAMADRMHGFLRRAVRAGSRVLVGDPQRAFLPRASFEALAEYEIPVPPALESVRVKRTTVWQLRAPAVPSPAGRRTLQGRASRA
ncbi:MAG TPA: 50S ribosomal protein L11 methyltransferase [Micromonosporaceae bacterium]